MRKREISAQVQGLSCTFPSGILESDLTARTEVKRKVFGGKNNGKFTEAISYDPVYFKNQDRTISCGIGALLFLAKNNSFVSIDFGSIKPERSRLSRVETPLGILKSSKWLVNGKERWYFHETLEACRRNHHGAVKLPTGAGKTPIELTLAHNQLREIGTGIILVPTNTIKDQFVKSAREFMIELRDYREWLYDLEYDKESILISLPGVVYNDIIGTDLQDPLYKTKLGSIKWVVGDEVHHSGCMTWNTIFLGLPSLSRSHGFSALPVDLSCHQSSNFAGMSIEDAMTISTVGPVIYEKSTKELKDFLNVPFLINLRYSWPKNVWPEQKTNDWRKLVELTYKNKQRMKLIADIIRTLTDRGYNTIAHVREKDFGTQLLALVGSDKCVTWYGGGEITGFSGSVNDLRSKIGSSILGVIGTSHLIEGLDLDSPLNAIVLTEGKDARQIIQKCGRITRPSNKPSVIINLVDSGLWILPRQSELRKATIQEEFDSDCFSAGSLNDLVAILGKMERIRQ